MTDDRPEPKYGQYAPIAPIQAVESAQVRAPEVAPAQLPPRRTWDVVLTTVLLLIGVYDVVSGFARFADLGSALNEAYGSQGIGEFTSIGLANSVGLVINIARSVLLVVAAGWALQRIAAHRLAFWVPLASALVAGVVVAVCVLVVLLNDPALAQYVADQAALQ